MTLLNYTNRNNDTQFVNSLIQNWDGNTYVLGIKAPSGWGKSSFTHDVTNSRVKDKVVVRITTVRSSQIHQGAVSFIEYIAKSLNNYAIESNSFNSIEEYLNVNQDNLSKTLGKALLEDIFNFVKLTSFGKEAIKRSGYFNNDNSFDISTIYIEYIGYVFREINGIIIIENIQSIDQYSFDILLKILESNPKIFFLLEYTQKNSIGIWEWDDIKVNIKAKNIPIEEYDLPPLDPSELGKATGINDNQTVILLKQLYKNDKGNLRIFEDYLVKVKGDSQYYSIIKNDKHANPTKDNILSLNIFQKHILALVVSHWGAVEEFIIYENHFYPEDLFANNNPEYIVQELIELQLIEIINSQLLLKHSSISTLFHKNDSNFSSITVANKLWKDYYKSSLDKKIYNCLSKFDILTRLIYFNFITNDIGANLLLINKLSSAAKTTMCPKMFIDNLNTIRKKCLESHIANKPIVIKKINELLIDIYYYLEDAKNSYKILEEIYEEENWHIAYKAMFIMV